MATRTRQPATSPDSKSPAGGDSAIKGSAAAVRAGRDPVSAYAEKVASGRVIAGRHVRDACQRHLRDLEEAKKLGLSWNLKAAQRALGFFRDVLRLNGGEWEGKPYLLIDWQVFIVGSLFGWELADGMRRFRVAFVETAKGSGKSPLAAGIGLYGLTADNEARAEIYAAATKKDQAQILFRDAVAMVDQSPALTSVIAKSGVGENVWNLAYRKSASWFRPISADDGQSGPRPHFSLLDEIHEHRNGYVVEMLRAGQKQRRQPLMFMITNSGTDQNSVCWGYHDYGAKVAAGQIRDESFFAYICALDDADDPLKDEACWLKVNPSLRLVRAKDGRLRDQRESLPGLKYLRDQVAQARGMPAKESIVRRLNFCQWVEAISPAIGRAGWFACEDKAFDRARLAGRKCWGGLDLSSTTDLTALALLFAPSADDPLWRLVVYFWLPGDGLADKADHDHVPYLAWREQGHLIALSGRAIDKLAVAKKVAELASEYDLQKLAYDRWRIEDFKRVCEDEGLALPLEPFGQGFKDMAPAVDEFERLLVGGLFRHDGNPVLTWCAANAVYAMDAAGNRKVTKEKATGRVDGIVAALMACGVKAVEVEVEPEGQLVFL